MAENILQYVAEDVKARSEQRKQAIDKITQMFQQQVPTPLEAAAIAQMTLTPLTRYEVARGIRAPTFVEAQAAARAAAAKYHVDTLDLLNKGLDGAARDTQILINALNASTNYGHLSAAKHKDVITSVTAGMSPESQVLFTKEYLSRLSAIPGDVDGHTAWNLAAEVVNAIDPKARRPNVPQFAKFHDEEGNEVTLQYNHDTGQYEIINVGRKAHEGPMNKVVPVERTYMDSEGDVVTETKYVVVQPGRAGESPQVVTEFPFESKKVKRKDITVKESTDLSTLRSVLSGLDSVQAALIRPDGSVDRQLLVAMRLQLPYTHGRLVRNMLADAIASYIFLKSGQTVTQQEREDWLSIFLPSPLDSDEGVKNKLARLTKMFTGTVDFLPKHMQDRLVPQERRGRLEGYIQSSALDEQKRLMLNRARQALLKGTPRESVEQLLREYGIDPAEL